MESRARSTAVAMVQWVVTPLALAALGYFIIGPRLGGAGSAARVGSPAPDLVSGEPVHDGPRTWTRPHPPQVDMNAFPLEEVPDPDEEETGPPEEEQGVPPVQGDEAGIGGIIDLPTTTEPPATTGGNS